MLKNIFITLLSFIVMTFFHCMAVESSAENVKKVIVELHNAEIQKQYSEFKNENEQLRRDLTKLQIENNGHDIKVINLETRLDNAGFFLQIITFVIVLSLAVLGYLGVANFRDNWEARADLKREYDSSVKQLKDNAQSIIETAMESTIKSIEKRVSALEEALPSTDKAQVRSQDDEPDESKNVFGEPEELDEQDDLEDLEDLDEPEEQEES